MMICDRVKLVEALKVVSPGLAGKAWLPLEMCFHFHSGRVWASNGRLCYIVNAPAGLENFNAALRGDLLVPLLNSSQAVEVKFDVLDKEVIIKMGRTVSRFTLLAPKWGVPEETRQSLDTKLFLEGLKAVKECAGTDPACPSRLGITFQIDEGHLEFFSTNNLVISHFITPIQSPAEASYQISLVGAEAILGISDIELVAFGPTSFHCVSKSGLEIFGSMYRESDVESYHTILNTLPKDYHEQMFESGGIQNVVERTAILSDGLKVKTKLSLVNRKLRFHTQSELGEIGDEVEVAVDGTVEVQVFPDTLVHAIVDMPKMAITARCVIFKSSNCTRYVSVLS